MKNNIILVGMMGAGKTFIGKCLKEKYTSFQLIDTDEYIEQSQNMKISEIFEKFGEKYFRDLETNTIKQIVQNDNQIISLGGGAFEREENRIFLNENGYTVYLKASPEIIYERIKSETHRPLLQQALQFSEEYAIEKISQILSKRQNNYEKALIIIDTCKKSKYNIIDEVMKRIEEYAK